MTANNEEKMLEKIEVLLQGMTELMQAPISTAEKIEKILFFANLMVRVKDEDTA